MKLVINVRLSTEFGCTYAERLVDLFTAFAAIETEAYSISYSRSAVNADTYRFSWMSSRTSNQTQH